MADAKLTIGFLPLVPACRFWRMNTALPLTRAWR